MAKNYHVSGNRQEGYRGKAEGAQRASVRGNTQGEVTSRLREVMGNNGGGELKIHGLDGQIRASDTVPPKKDNFPPRG
jgi:hypothetical protein